MTIWAGVGVLFVALLVLGSCLGGGSGEVDGTSAAEVACERAVKGQLKDPSSAEFDGHTTTRNSETSFTVTGTVRGTNSFGAVVPTQYTCQATYDPAEDVATATAVLN